MPWAKGNNFERLRLSGANGVRSNDSAQEGREKEVRPQGGEVRTDRYRQPQMTPKARRELERLRALAKPGALPLSRRPSGGSCRGHVYRTKGKGSRLVTAMVKATWNDLLARFPEPHVLVAVLPASSEKESIFNAQSAQRLMVRLIRNLPTQGEFAVMVSRQSGQCEILCAFGDSSDAALIAKAANASMSDRARYSFVLDESAERNLLKIAGPPEPHRPRATASDRGNISTIDQCVVSRRATVAHAGAMQCMQVDLLP